MDLNNPDRIIYEYVRYFHLGFVFVDNPKNVLFIGGGGFTGPKDFLKSYPNVKIDVVEIDRDVIQVGKDYFFVPEDERLQIINQDGRQYLSNTINDYDIIILDAYDKSYVPFHLMTMEFHEIINNHLSDNGVFIANIITSLNGKSSDLFRAEYKTLDTVFPNVYVYPLSLNQEQMVQNVIIVAHKQDTRLENKTINQDYNLSFNIVDFVDKEYNKSIKIDDVPILTDDFAPVENFMNPLTGKTYFKKIILQNSSSITVPEEKNYGINQNRGEIIVGSFIVIIIFYLSYTYLFSYTQKKEN
jgi:spermidine synthase